MDKREDDIRAYSPDIMRRLLQHLKPYKIAVAITLFTLALSTAAELLMPIVLQRALDMHLLRREYRLDSNAISAGLPGPALADIQNTGRSIGQNVYVPIKALDNLGRAEKDAARKTGWLHPDYWYVFKTDSESIAGVLKAYPDIFETDAGLSAIRIADRKTLNPAEKRIILSRDIQGIKIKTLQYLILLVITLMFTFGQVYAASWISQKIMADIRVNLLAHIMRQSLSSLNKKPVGSLVSRVANDVATISEFFTNVSTSFLKDGAIMAGVIGVIFALNIRLALVAMLTLVPTFILIAVFQKQLREAYRRVRVRLSAVNTFLSEHISGISTVQLFDAEKRSARDFDNKTGDLLKAEMQQLQIMAVFRPLIDFIASTAIALIIWHSTGLYSSGLVTLGVLIAFSQLIQKFFDPVRDIAEKFDILQSAMAGSERIFALMDEQSIIPEGKPLAMRSPTSSNTKIAFEDVHFSYLPGEPVLSGLSFSIPAGETVAIVGSTGAGKTTIANLITRLWDPQEGRILLDAVDIRNQQLEHLRKTIQPIQQDVFLFSGSIADNIDLGLKLSRKEIEDAASIARADEFIRRLPDAYNTNIAEGAANISAGQRQLIAFARIIAHNPEVIILDEATSNVDTETEHLLQEGMNSLLGNRTALIIAHRLSTIRRANKIMVLGRGKLIEQGSHNELLAKGGAYKTLYELQFS